VKEMSHKRRACSTESDRVNRRKFADYSSDASMAEPALVSYSHLLMVSIPLQIVANLLPFLFFLWRPLFIAMGFISSN
jgi:hypothetical protein